jgi:hypothetical protein
MSAAPQHGLGIAHLQRRVVTAVAAIAAGISSMIGAVKLTETRYDGATLQDGSLPEG